MLTLPHPKDWSENLLSRFCRYVQVYTTSDPLSTSKPSSPGQWDLLKMLSGELSDLGVKDLEMMDNGYLLARIPGSPGKEKGPSIALIAHVDTASDAPGEGVKPIIHRNYDGNDLLLSSGLVLSAAENPVLNSCQGKTIITSDGRTLLGADDKAGVAEIMTAVALWIQHPELPHGPIEILFTTDEEVGRGTEGFPLSSLKSNAAYTLDGDQEGTYQTECYYASAAEIKFTGISHHPGDARGKLVNALSMAGAFITMIPRSESPEATDGRFGCLWPNHLEGGLEAASLKVMIRDFSLQELERRETFLKTLGLGIEGAFPGGKVEITITRQYDNMKEGLVAHPRVTEILKKAIESTGLTPEAVPIRGGTDGARLTALGLPTPNIFTGGMNYHSRREWACLEVMAKAVETVLHLGYLWSLEDS